MWNALRDRLQELPLVLAGPILRRTDAQAITVWVAVQSPCTVKLTVRQTTAQGATLGDPVAQGQRATVAIGEFLHVVAVTAPTAPQEPPQSGVLYAYDLEFTATEPHARSPQTLQQAMTGTLGPTPVISYFPHQLPTFALPPETLHQLKIVHGSCRKLHGNGYDALAIADELIGHNAESPGDRPHYLFLTGDQIYGDEVADPLLWALSRMGNTLLGWEEQLPTSFPVGTPGNGVVPQTLKPGQRSQIAETHGGFTAGVAGQAECAKSHLFSLGEYCAVYLYAWSPVLWSLPLPTAKDMDLHGKAAKQWKTELAELHSAAHTLWKVRRALANVPTYMIFDDHDISDDWNLNQGWCLRVLGKALGRRTVQNGMLAYAVFQAWGNTPDQFVDQQVGDRLLQAAAEWSTSAGTDLIAWSAISSFLGLPTQTPTTGLPQMRVDGDALILDRAADALIWHYTVRGPQHTIIVLDTRTWRGYPLTDQLTAPPQLLSPTAFQQQLVHYLEDSTAESAIAETDELTLIVAPTNLFSLQLIDQIQYWNIHQNEVYKNDVGDAWNIHRQALANFLQIVFSYRQQVLILSGDIHYGSAVYLQYWQASEAQQAAPNSDQPERQQTGQSPEPHVLVQLTASAFKNSEAKTRMVHTKLKNVFPERLRTWVGWFNPVELQETTQRVWLRWFGPAASPKHRRPEPPDWHYQTQWIPRQPAQTPPWGTMIEWLAQPPRRSTWRSRLQNWIFGLWRSRWVQEGREVVGRNNFGVVHLDASPQATRAVVRQDLYWYAPWEGGQVVYSRYEAPLVNQPGLTAATAGDAARAALAAPTHSAASSVQFYPSQSGE